MKHEITTQPRREFLKRAAVAAAGVALQPYLPAAGTNPPATTPHPGGIPRRPLGRTGEMVSLIGLGGHTLALAKTESESIRIVHEAVDAGLNFMDNAGEYNEGRSERIMGQALKGRRDRAFLMTKVCTHGKGKDVGMQLLEESLKRLQTDRLDLWMIHAIEKQSEVDAAFAPGGVIEALELAKKQGKVRYVGFTGHKDPKLHLAMLKHDYHFDAVLMPINCFDAGQAGFRTDVLAELNRQQIGALGIKSMGGAPANVVRSGKLTAAQAIRFALSHPITTQIVGMNSLENLHANLATARNFKPLSEIEISDLVQQFATADNRMRFANYTHPDYRDGSFNPAHWA
ncbi:MAG: aldo/keto reductase [Verrucomicrobia bacterium]|nr:aldo/keto reductase [Verrucomicrobiota bacterium]